MLLSGLHHAAVITADLDRFTEFYAGVFEGEVIPIEPTPAFRHALVRVGGSAVLHPVEVTESAHNAGSTAMLARGHLDHLALHAGSLEALHEIRKRLMARGACDGTVMDLGAMLSLGFTDPDGMQVEVCWNRDPSLRDLQPPKPTSVY